jgi:predicted nucleic acid-binding protein
VTVFVDTSALLALLDPGDDMHQQAGAAWRGLVGADVDLRTSNYVVLEGTVVGQRRLGLGGVQALLLDLLPLVQVDWVTPDLHDAAITALLVANRRDLSLVDCVSFELMRRQGITTAFTFDPHFAEQGFEVLPAKG